MTRVNKQFSWLGTVQNHWKRFLSLSITLSLLFRELLRVSDRNTLEQVLYQYILLFLISANGKPHYQLSNYLIFSYLYLIFDIFKHNSHILEINHYKPEDLHLWGFIDFE